MSDMLISQLLKRSVETKALCAEQCSQSAEDAAQLIAKRLISGGKLMICGNGGSAGDAQHLAAEFVATLDHAHPRRAYAALALTTDTSFITAYTNDFGFEGIFARQIDALGKAEDVLLAISTSGNSNNVLRAIEAAQTQGIAVIALTGETGGNMADSADILLNVPSQITMHIQECHIALGHAITARIEELLATDEN